MVTEITAHRGHGTYTWADDLIAEYEAAHPNLYIASPEPGSSYWIARDRDTGMIVAAEPNLAALRATVDQLPSQG